MTLSLAKRPFPSAAGITIDRNGVVWASHRRVPTTHATSKLGVRVLAVGVHDFQSPVPIWKVLSHVWYESRMILPRDGNAFNYDSDNTIELKSVSSLRISDPEEILLIWVTYCKGFSCWQLPEKTGIHTYSRDELYGLIKDILVAGIR